jgi:ABC-type multidrug transport system ATPase subunit
MTLLLGPPGSGKTTLLLALAGRLDKSLRVKGEVTLNGHTHVEFVPQRTAAYISQRDLHVGQMTVRETLDFSAKCQGTGTRYGEFLGASIVVFSHLDFHSLVLRF